MNGHHLYVLRAVGWFDESKYPKFAKPRQKTPRRQSAICRECDCVDFIAECVGSETARGHIKQSCICGYSSAVWREGNTSNTTRICTERSSRASRDVPDPAVESSELEANCLPSGEYATELTWCSCPLNGLGGTSPFNCFIPSTSDGMET